MSNLKYLASLIHGLVNDGASIEEITDLLEEGISIDIYDEENKIDFPHKIRGIDNYDWKKIEEVIESTRMWRKDRGGYWNFQKGHRSSLEAYKIIKKNANS
jgi:hypothetical protein